MANRITYAGQYIFVGPSPSSGFSFCTYLGELNDRYFQLGNQHNLLKQIGRVQNCEFSLEANRTDIRALGNRSLIDRPNIEYPTINLSFSYLLNGLAQDARVGLNVNFAQYQYPYSGTPFYSDNFQVSLLSGLIGRQHTQPTGDPYWPYPMRDNRNIFLVRSEYDYEELQILGEYKFDKPDTTKGVDPRCQDYKVMAFGNCYLNSYETSAAVNSIPKSTVSWSCENVAFYMSGSGCFIPAINTQTREQINQNHFNIPEIREEGGPWILKPSDIILDITPSGYNSLTGLGIAFSDIKITDYTWNIDFNRENVSSLGYKCPLDKEVVFPVIANLQFGLIVGDMTSGHFIDILNQDSGYNITIKLRNPLCNSPFFVSGNEPRHDGPALKEGEVGIRYDFRGARFENISFNSAIGENKRANLNFSVEVNPDDLSKGLWISGHLNLDRINDYLLDESGWHILDENSGILVTNSQIWF